ncbi:MAG: hypothetical protein JNM10_06740, partial [Planctomycetia bacterium]|nr:hypothetical protein [Planctomycetia bacterium]
MPPAPLRTSRPRSPWSRCAGASSTTLLAGVAVVLLLLAVALTLATRRRPAPQTAADAWSVIPTPPAAAPRAPRTGPRVVADRPPAPTAPADAPPRIDPETVPAAPPSVPSPTAPSPTDPPFPPPPALPEPPAAPAHPPAAPPSVVEAPAAPTRTEPEDPAPPPATARPEPEVVGPTAPTPPPTANTPTATAPTATPPTATSPTSPPPTESSAGRGAPEPDPAPDRTPAATAPAAGAPSAKPPVLGREPFLVVVAGPEMSVVVAEAGRRARDAGLVTARAEPFVFTTSLDQGTLPDVEVRAEAGAVLLVAGPEPVVGVDPVGDLVPPVRLLGPLLREVSLPVAKTAHGPAVVALAAILAGDGRAALAQLDTLPAPASPTAADAGLRLLRAAAALVARDYPAVHKATFGLAEDPVLGPTARVLTGAALRADRNPAEALRDFEAALVVRPDLWVARLLLAEACETEELQFPDRAAAAYAAVLKAAPDEP